jgi:hypothetical protein
MLKSRSSIVNFMASTMVGDIMEYDGDEDEGAPS